MAVGAFAVIAALLAPSFTAADGPPGVLVMAAKPRGTAHIYTLDPATGKQRLLSGGRTWDVAPAWSPDGRRIAYQSTRKVRIPHYPTADQIVVMRADGSGKRVVSDGRAIDAAPAWSPDGKRIAFLRTTPVTSGTSYPSLWTMRAGGGGLRRLTRTSRAESRPAWSPDGRLIAFGRARSRSESAWDLWVVRPDGTGLRRVARDATTPAWSPDGRRLTFGKPKRDASGCGCARDLYVMNADGSARRLLARNGSRSSWSSDGGTIAFDRVSKAKRGEGLDVWTIRPDGTGLKRVTSHAGEEFSPAWRP